MGAEGLVPGVRVTVGRGKRVGTVSATPTGAGGYVYVVWPGDETLTMEHVRDLKLRQGG